MTTLPSWMTRLHLSLAFAKTDSTICSIGLSRIPCANMAETMVADTCDLLYYGAKGIGIK